jgi:hypothetical protein
VYKHYVAGVLSQVCVCQGVSQACVSGVFLRSVSQGCVPRMCLRGVSQGCVSGVCLRGVSPGRVTIFAVRDCKCDFYVV